MLSRFMVVLMVASSGTLAWAQEQTSRSVGGRGWYSLGGIVAHWRFTGEPGRVAPPEERVSPLTGQGKATLLGGPMYHAVDGLLGLQFSAGDDRVFVEDAPAFAITGSLTLEAVIRCDGVAPGSHFQNQIVFRGDDRPGLDPYFLAVSLDGRLMFHIQDEHNQYTEVLSPTPLPTGRVLHIAGTLDDASNAMDLYINGKRVSSGVTNIRPMGALDAGEKPGLGIGNIQSGTYPEGFNGLIVEVRISNRVLAPKEFLRAAAHPADQQPRVRTIRALSPRFEK